MEEQYLRNRIYVNEEEQKKIKSFQILLAGAGIGSVIAECALRFGFENITIIDGDIVETSNLNRQNYIKKDIGQFKATALTKRLLEINPNANIVAYNCFINENNIEDFVIGHDVAINALDFNNSVPFLFDDACKENAIPVLHPYNIGWAGLVTIIMPDSPSLKIITESPKGFEVSFVEYATEYLRYWGHPLEWIEEIVKAYKNEIPKSPPPQLAIGSWILGGLCVNILFNLATGRTLKYFPKFYLSSILNDNN